MEDALTARLLACPSLSAIIGTRLNWGERVPGEPLAALTALLVSPGRGYVHAGADTISNPRVQFDCYAASSLECRALARALRDEMEQPATIGGVAFSVALVDGERGPVIEDIGGGAKVHRWRMDFIVWCSPAA